MKRIFLVILAFAFYIIANAQILITHNNASAQFKDKVWNLRFGVSDRKQVENVIKALSLKTDIGIGGDIICYSDTSFDFAGEEWNYAKFSFYLDKLYSYSFRYSSSFSLKESFERLKNSLDNEYSDFISEKDLNNDRRWYIVYKTRTKTIKLSYHFSHNGNSVDIECWNDRLKREKETHTR